jgi:hypothetical protein
MKNAILLMIAITMCLMGCAVSQQVDINHQEKWIREANHHLLGREVTVETIDGREHEGRCMSLSSGTLLLREGTQVPILSLRLDKVKMIKPERNIGSPVAGFLGGAIGGALLGAAVGAGSASEFDAVGAAAEGAIYGAVIGGLSIGLIGGITSAVTDYELSSNIKQTSYVASSPFPPALPKRTR